MCWRCYAVTSAEHFAEEAIARHRLARRNDDRMTRRRIGKGKKALWEIGCSGCGKVLVVDEDVDMALALARVNVTARPCCGLWPNP